VTRRHPLTRSVAVVAVAAIAGVGLTACKDDDATGQNFSQTFKGQGGRQSAVMFGSEAKIPKDFPSSVPLPDVGPLRAIATGKNPPNSSFNMTYSLSGRNGTDAGNTYRNRLQQAGFRIEHYSSLGGSDGDMTQFDAIGKSWDVAVVSGKATPRDRSTMSVQVRTHGSVDSGISGIGNTNPDPDPNANSGLEPPDDSSSTATTTG
jgi:hypothetical protein